MKLKIKLHIEGTDLPSFVTFCLRMTSLIFLSNENKFCIFTAPKSEH